jgi:5'-nucleotidase
MAKLGNVAVVLACVAMLSVTTLADAFKLLIVHTNDMHSRFNQTSKASGLCSEQEAAMNQCYGGFARVSEAVKLARARSKMARTQSLFLIAGDIYQGTLLYSIYKWKIVATLTNMLRPDAMVRLVHFTFPILTPCDTRRMWAEYTNL